MSSPHPQWRGGSVSYERPPPTRVLLRQVRARGNCNLGLLRPEGEAGANGGESPTRGGRAAKELWELWTALGRGSWDEGKEESP